MSDETDLIKERLDLADVIGEYVPLKRAGGHYKGLCPFHQEKSPSFIVSPDKRIWHCFGCGESGDIFTFVQRLEGLDFPATLKMLAARAGVKLKERGERSTNTRARLFDVLSASAKFYHEILVRHEAGTKAREYLAKRGVKPETIKLFQIGYAPQQWNTLEAYLTKKGFTIGEMTAAGVVGKNQQGKTYDRFRARIMFPVQDIQGRIVAFGGRIVPWHETGNEGKYVNSPETSVYEKRNVVYNLDQAKQAIRQQQVAIIVEGYMDVVMLVQQGVENVVASSGTALTEQHITQLQRFAPTLHFAFDSDPAGQKAAIAATRTALAAGARVATLPLPPGLDPADVALQHPDKLSEYFTTPRTLVSVLLAQLKATPDAQAREKLLEEVLPLVKSVRNVVQQGEMIQEMATLLHVPEAVIVTRLASSSALTAVPSVAIAPDTPLGVSGFTAEQRLLGLLASERTLLPGVLPHLQPEHFTNTTNRQLFMELQQGEISATLLPLAEAAAQLSQEERRYSTLTAAQEAEQLVRLLQRRQLEERLQALQQQLITPGQAAAPEALQEFQSVAQALEQVKAGR